MVDAHGLGPCEATRGGSNPLFGTKLKNGNKKTRSKWRGFLSSERSPGEEEPSEMILL